MKKRFTNAKKARRLNVRHCYQDGITSMSVLERRVHGIYGADHLQHDAKHPDIEMAVEGVKQKIAEVELMANLRQRQ